MSILNQREVAGVMSRCQRQAIKADAAAFCRTLPTIAFHLSRSGDKRHDRSAGSAGGQREQDEKVPVRQTRGAAAWGQPPNLIRPTFGWLRWRAERQRISVAGRRCGKTSLAVLSHP
jgi:hypothetical protein